MFEATVKSNVLKEIVDVISTLVNEAKFAINDKSVCVKAVDPAHVAMIDLIVHKTAFDVYNASELEMGIDLEKLKDVLKLARADDPISIKFDEDKTKLILKIQNITRRMPIVDVTSMSEPKLPNLVLPTKVVVKASELDQGIRASESVSDHVTLMATPDGFELKSEGDMDSVNLRLPKDLLGELKCDEDTRSTFSLEYFSNMVKSIAHSENVTMSMGTDYPVKLEFDIAEKNGHVIYLLAPRIEGE